MRAPQSVDAPRLCWLSYAQASEVSAVWKQNHVAKNAKHLLPLFGLNWSIFHRRGGGSCSCTWVVAFKIGPIDGHDHDSTKTYNKISHGKRKKKSSCPYVWCFEFQTKLARAAKVKGKEILKEISKSKS